MTRIIYPCILKNFCVKTLAAQMTVVLLSFSSPLFVTNMSWSQTPTGNKVNEKISQPKPEDIQKDLQAIDGLIKLGRLFDAEAIIKYLKPNKNKKVRIHAINALKIIGKDAEAALPALTTVIQERNVDRELQMISISAIKSINPNKAVPVLIGIINNPDPKIAEAAIDALISVRKDATDAVPKLLSVLQSQNQRNLDVRIKAAEALGAIGTIKPEVISALIEALDDPAWLLRNQATVALKNLKGWRADTSSAVPKLQKELQNSNITLRKNAIDALGSMGFQAKETVPKLIEFLQDEDSSIRTITARSLADISTDIEKRKNNTEGKEEKKIGPEMKKTFPALVNAIITAIQQKEDWFPKESIKDVSKIITHITSNADKIDQNNLEEVITELDKLLNKTENFLIEEPAFTGYRDSIKQQLDFLKGKKTERQIINGIIKNPSVWFILIYLVSLFGMFCLRPLWLLKLENILKPLSFKIPYLDKEISLSALLLMLVKHPRVLDAWVEEYIKVVREEFQTKDTVSNRNVFIPVPVTMHNKTIAHLSGKDLHAVFKKQRDCLLIQGEGGVGKTSLACQIANWAMSESEGERLCKHRMIPVLIEEDLDVETIPSIQANVQVPAMQKKNYKQALMSAIRGQLQDLTNEPEPISEELLERLLRQRRILVIVDHFSEMSDDTRKAICPDSPEFPVNALIITSRSEETLGRVTKTTIKPLRIEGNRLSSFMEAYLTQQGKRDLFTDAEFFDACRRLSQMVGNRNITVLLAKLYAEQLIATRVEEVRELPIHTPNNIPDLMLWYLNELNRTVAEENRLRNPIIQQDTKALAWQCLQQTLRPGSIKREVALDAIGGEDPETRLKYLEERLHLIQTVGPAQDLRFALDPLAEYLAALYLIKCFGRNEQCWQEFKQRMISVPEAPDSIKGFLLALRDCLTAERVETTFRDFLEENLSKQTDSVPVGIAA